MARIRTIKPEIWTDEKVMALSPLALILFIGAWNFCDDYGYMEPSSKTLAMRVIPHRRGNPDKLVAEIFSQGLFEPWQDQDGRVWWKVSNFQKHQKVAHPHAERVLGAKKMNTPNSRDFTQAREAS